jgi:hypothetical protein
MKGSALIAGILIMAGLVAGAAVIAFAGRANTKELESKLEAASASIEAAAARIGQLEKRMTALAEKQETNNLLIETNSARLAELSQRISRAEDMRKVAAVDLPAVSPPAPGMEPSASGRETPEAVEALKEQVKKEIEEERRLREQKEREQMTVRVKEMQTKEWRKQIDDEFPKLAQKIGLNATQEMEVREIAENAFKELMMLLEEAMSKPQSEVDWAAFQEKTKKIYEEAEAQIVPLVSEEQAKALRKFFDVPGR